MRPIAIGLVILELRRRRSGYALLMSLAVITLAGLILASMARQSLLLAMESLDAQDDLQRRWGAFSCQQALLARAEKLLERQMEREHNRVTRQSLQEPDLSTTVVLGGMTFELLLADEDAKVNLNTVYALRGAEAVTSVVRELARSKIGPEVMLRPNGNRSTQPYVAAFDSWGQVFALDRAPPDNPMPGALVAATTSLTCWGSGKLNLRRAPDSTLEQISRLAVGSAAARRLLDIRREDPNRNLSDMLNRLQLHLQERRQIQRLLTNRSTCYSLWTTIRTDERSWYELRVTESAPDSDLLVPADRGPLSSEDSAHKPTKATTPAKHFIW